MEGKIDPTVPQAVINAVIVKARLDHQYNARWADSKWFQWCDMVPVVRRTEAYSEPNQWGDSWAVEVQYSSRGGRALYGVNRNHVPSCYMD